ncbi:hypothetical protein ABVT39_010768 [Epinephelus coioides]
MDVISRPELFEFQGIWLTHYYTDNWENFENFQARPDDILITSYPKAGNTWFSYILDLLYFGQTSPERHTSVPLYRRVPFLEVHIPSLQPELVDKLPTSPRIIKTHLPVQFVPKSFWEQNCKVIDAFKDSVVSYFHFERMTMINPEPGDWNSYLQRFLEGKVVFGSWYDHVNDWWEKKQSYPNLCYMFYEEMIKDTGRDLDKLCCFLGLSPSAEEKEEILRKVQFDEMKKNDMVNFSTFRAMDFKKSTFMRKGKVGDWKNHFTVAQSEEFDEDYKKKMKNPTLQFHTEA